MPSETGASSANRKGRPMRRKMTALGAVLLVGATIGVPATTASAQPHVDCWGPLTPGCAVVNKVLAEWPGYVEDVRNVVLPVYDKVTGTARCVISGECP